MKFKLDLLLKNGASGAAETYYLEAGNVGEATDIALALATLRRDLMPAVAIIQGFRLTKLDTAGLPTGRSRSFNRSDAGLAGTADTRRDEEDVALLVRCFSTDGDHTKLTHLRFLQDNQITYDAAGNFDSANPLFAAPFAAYKAELEGGTYFIREFDADPNSNPATSPILEFRISALGAITAVTQDIVPGLVAGNRFKIKGYSGALGKQLNGMHRALAVTGTDVLLDVEPCHFVEETKPGAGAVLFKERYLFFVIAVCDHEGPSSHDTGRAFFLRRGRRSKRPPCRFTRAGAL